MALPQAAWSWGGLILEKLLIFQWGAPSQLAADLAEDPQRMRAAVINQMVEDKLFSPPLQARMESEDEQDYTEEQASAFQQQFDAEIDQRIATMSQEEKQQAVESLANTYIASLSLSDRLEGTFSFWDLLWFGLAIATAFQIASGASAGNAEA